jgi:hypothetical protein
MKSVLSLCLLFILILTSSCEEFDDFLDTETTSTTLPTTVNTEPVTTKTTTTSTTTTSTSSFSTNTTSSSEATIKHFEGKGVSFYYPGTWEQIQDSDLIAFFKDKETGALIQVAVTELGMYTSKKDLEVYQESWVDGTGGLLKSERYVESISGDPGMESLYEIDDLEGKVVSFVVFTKIYDLSFTVPAASFGKANKDFNVMATSFKYY